MRVLVDQSRIVWALTKNMKNDRRWKQLPQRVNIGVFYLFINYSKAWLLAEDNRFSPLPHNYLIVPSSFTVKGRNIS